MAFGGESGPLLGVLLGCLVQLVQQSAGTGADDTAIRPGLRCGAHDERAQHLGGELRRDQDAPIRSQ